MTHGAPYAPSRPSASIPSPQEWPFFKLLEQKFGTRCEAQPVLRFTPLYRISIINSGSAVDCTTGKEFYWYYFQRPWYKFKTASDPSERPSIFPYGLPFVCMTVSLKCPISQIRVAMTTSIKKLKTCFLPVVSISTPDFFFIRTREKKSLVWK